MVIVDSSIVLVALPSIGADPGVRARGSAALAGLTYRRWSSSTVRSPSAWPMRPLPAWRCSSRCSPIHGSSATSSLHAAHAEPLSRAGDAAGAVRAYKRAIALT